MPQIIVTAGDSADLKGEVTLRERINTRDFESERFTVNLLERIGWAVDDAAEAELDQPSAHDAPEPVKADETDEAETAPELVEA